MRQTKEEFKKTLITEHKNFKVGDKISWTNDYGVYWENKILGFDNEGNLYLDSDSYWFPHDPKRYNTKKI